jgi:hypothetical protein
LATTIRYEGWVFAVAILLAVAASAAPKLVPGVEYLMFQTQEHKNSLNSNLAARKLKDFGPWSVYSVLRLSPSPSIVPVSSAGY